MECLICLSAKDGMGLDDDILHFSGIADWTETTQLMQLTKVTCFCAVFKNGENLQCSHSLQNELKVNNYINKDQEWGEIIDDCFSANGVDCCFIVNEIALSARNEMAFSYRNRPGRWYFIHRAARGNGINNNHFRMEPEICSTTNLLPIFFRDESIRFELLHFSLRRRMVRSGRSSGNHGDRRMRKYFGFISSIGCNDLGCLVIKVALNSFTVRIVGSVNLRDVDWIRGGSGLNITRLGSEPLSFFVCLKMSGFERGFSPMGLFGDYMDHIGEREVVSRMNAMI